MSEFSWTESPYLIPFDDSFELSESKTEPPAGAPNKKECKRRLSDMVEELHELQRVLYADNRFSVLLIFQAMDAAGKDSTIRAVLSGVDPAGFQVFSFKQPSAEELDHDFLWRTSVRLPERGRVGVFNRSYYEEVLVVRVHPEYLSSQRLPGIHKNHTPSPEFWQGRFESIRDHERHLARNGTVILKFWLNVSKAEQRERFLDRIDVADKNWKFAAGDVAERRHWDSYMAAYEDMLQQTSRPWAPWYAIPADSKSYLRLTVARTVVDTLNRLNIRYPEVDPRAREELEAMRVELVEEDR